MAYCTDTNRRAAIGRSGCPALGAARREPWRLTIFRFATDLIGTFQTWRARTIERRQLLGLDDRMLKDIGVSREDAEAEARKPFYR